MPIAAIPPESSCYSELNFSYARADVDVVMEKLSSEIVWNIIGELEIRGRAEVRATLESMKDAVARD